VSPAGSGAPASGSACRSARRAGSSVGGSSSALRAATGRWRHPQPADWIDAHHEIRSSAIALVE
jgi:hypothetical protein